MEIKVENIPKELIEKPRWFAEVGVERGREWQAWEMRPKPTLWCEDGKERRYYQSLNLGHHLKGLPGIQRPKAMTYWFRFKQRIYRFRFWRFKKPLHRQLFETSLSEIKKLNSYTEVSPSQEGAKTLTRAKLPQGGHHKGERGDFW